MKDYLRKGQLGFVHPIYVELQKRSPLGRSDYPTTMHEFDFSKYQIDLADFYQNHVSKSMPLLMKQYAG